MSPAGATRGGRFGPPVRAACRAAGIALCLAAPFASGTAWGAPQTSAKQAYILDLETGAVLLDKDGATPVPPASLSKLMTLYMVFDKLRRGEIALDERFVVSRKAWRMGGSKTFVRVGERVRLEDLVRGAAVQSGNDACIVIAEGLSDSESAFARAMNRKAREIGLTGSNFVNATGWPAENHFMTPRDVAILSRRLIEEFPEYYPYFAEKVFTHNGIRQSNRNPLLYRSGGADGLKTGYTRASGYSLAASAVRDGRRIVMVLTGFDSARRRTADARRLLDWAFRSFSNYALFRRGETVERAGVWLGAADSVALVAGRDIAVSLPLGARPGLRVTVVYEGPVPAPIAKGAEIARLVIAAPGFETLEAPLLAAADVARASLFRRTGMAIGYLFRGARR